MKVKAVLIVIIAVVTGGCSANYLNYLFGSYVQGLCDARNSHCAETPEENPRMPAPHYPTLP